MQTKGYVRGWYVEITGEYKVKMTDSDGFTFSKIYCTSVAQWNDTPVYFTLSGGTRGVRDVFATIEDMRAAYRDDLNNGWTAF